ncbi:MAG: hypothetical protein H0W89_00760 [Candidatus Levybacteria bacterium]|nr:hypothetical protein [Candidatus Levybacteria bacterium]
MARKKISEYRAKQILTKALELPYEGVCVDADHLLQHESIDSNKLYVVKVDEGVKKRMKQGLVLLKQTAKEIPQAIVSLQQKGYTHFIIEQFIPHEKTEEKYLSLSLTREGIVVLYSDKGGIDVEEKQETIKKIVISNDKEKSRSDLSSIAWFRDDKRKEIAAKLIEIFNKYHFTLLEINPLVITKDSIYFLDIAAEVDNAAEFFVDAAWKDEDYRESDRRTKTEEEEAIEKLSQKSQASFKLEVLNADGSVFMLLSGGGASIVLADEVYNVGHGKELANYGEYSGNPNAEEVYLYTKNLISLLLKSKAQKKVLIIAGGVANFTDVRLTFAGIIKALDAEKDALRDQNIKVFVRRGGPHQKEGLANMQNFLQKEALLGNVSGPEMPLQEIVTLALKTI